MARQAGGQEPPGAATLPANLRGPRGRRGAAWVSGGSELTTTPGAMQTWGSPHEHDEEIFEGQAVHHGGDTDMSPGQQHGAQLWPGGLSGSSCGLRGGPDTASCSPPHNAMRLPALLRTFPVGLQPPPPGPPHTWNLSACPERI